MVIAASCTGVTSIGDICTKAICARVDFRGAFTEAAVACVGGFCVCSAVAVERSEMYLQSFQILEIGGARLKI